MQTNTKTYWQIMSDKFKNVLENGTFKGFMKGAWICAGTCVLTGLLTFPEQSIVLIENALKYQNYLLPKAGFSFVLFYNLENIINSVKSEFEKFTPPVDMVEGIPTLELIDYLFNNQTFKRDDIEAVFGIPRNRFDILAKKLDDLKVLIRGANNGRVLNPEMSRQEIVQILASWKKAKELKQTFNEIKENYFAAAPAIMKNIKEKFADILPKKEPTHNFTRRPLQNHVFVKNPQKDMEFRKDLPFTIDLSHLSKKWDPVFPSLETFSKKIDIEFIS